MRVPLRDGGRSLVLGLSALVVLVAGVVVMLRGDAPAPQAATAAPRVEAPTSVDAGAVVPVVVDAMDGRPQVLRVTSGVATELVDVPAGDGRVEVELPARLTEVAGLLTVTPVGHPGAAVHVEVLPGVAVDPAAPLVGQRSVVVGEQDAMVTVVPTDRLGNTITAGLPVTVTARRPDGAQDAYTTATDGMLAWTWVPSGLFAGRTMLGVEAGAARGPAADLVEVPAAPREVVATVEGGVPPADGRSTFTVRTEELRDRFGNLLLDGIHADVLVDGPTGRSAIAAQVVGGRVTALVVVPDEAAVLRVVVRVDGTESVPLDVAVRRATDGLAASAEARDGRILVQVGPVLDPRGAYLPDGTVVSVDGEDAGQLVDGVAVLDLDDDGATTLEVEVAGLRAVVRVVRA